MPGASGRPVARSQTMVDARWFATPTAATGPPSASAGVRHLERGIRHDGGVEFDQIRARRLGEHGHVVHVVDGGVGAHDGGPDPRRPHVDDQDASARAAHDQGDGPKGDGRSNLDGLRIPAGSSASFSARSTAKPSPRAPGMKRDRFNPIPWWWLMAAPCSMVVSVTVSQACR